ncbi:hypothetical protein ACFPMF_27840 [Larkinella bovis]|uniref:Tetratricopeptide repeat protein n=1 Tax=Larkinella bovis TaxID=683041 RepID=A0ABW0ILC5_9BACT
MSYWLVLMAQVASAQSLTLENVAGDVRYQITKQAPVQRLSVAHRRQSIDVNGWITLGRQAEVLLRKDAQTVYFIRNRAGKYQLKTLLDSALPPDFADALNLFFETLWFDLTHAHDTPEKYSVRFRRTGISSRGSEDCPQPLMISPDFKAGMRDTIITFRWKKDPAARAYKVAIFSENKFDAHPLYQTETTDTTLAFDLRRPLFKKNRVYYWAAIPAQNSPCTLFDFRIYDQATLEAIRPAESANLKATSADRALTAFMIASNSEAKGLYAEAQKAYEQAVRLSPSNPMYREGLILYLARRGQVEEANRR